MDFETYRSMQKEIEINGHKLSYVDVGTGPVMLLIHGIPVWGYLWKDMIDLLQDDYRLIIPDLLGYGYSDQRDRFDRAVTVQAQYVMRLLTELGIQEKFHLVGHDIGGAVAQRIAVDHADQMHDLILVDSVLLDSWPAEPMIRLGNPQSNQKYQGDELAKVFVERLPAGFKNTERATPALFEGWMKPYTTEAGKLSLIRNAAALNTNHTMEIMEELKALPVPQHLIWAALDQFQPLESAQRFVEAVPGTELHIIEASDHFLPLEQPQQLADKIRSIVA